MGNRSPASDLVYFLEQRKKKRMDKFEFAYKQGFAAAKTFATKDACLKKTPEVAEYICGLSVEKRLKAASILSHLSSILSGSEKDMKKSLTLLFNSIIEDSFND